MGKPTVYIPRLPPVNAKSRPTASVTDMAQRMANDRQRRAREANLAQQRRESEADVLGPLTTAAVIGALNDLTPADPTPSDFSGAGGDFGGGGATGDF